jgi:GT2 family glycosyltransferase/predicted SAM-dependent methyltransferase
LEYTKQCIESIRQYTRPGTYELIIVDNASSDSTREWVREQKDIRAIFNDENLGFPKGCNQGIEISNGDNILLLNNDVVVTSHWLENMLSALYSDESVGAVSCVTNHCSYKQTVPANYETMDEMQKFAATFNHSDPEKWEERLKLVGFCLLFKRVIVHTVGLLDELFTPGNHEDDDFSIRMRQAGYRLLLCKDTFIHHYGSVSFKSQEQDLKYRQLLQKNEQKFQKKWGFDSNYSQHIRYELIDLIEAPLDAPLRILEVGCACGGTLLGIKSMYKNSKLHGIELNKNSGRIASLIAEMLDADVEKDDLSYPEEYFDYIICADVLEHMSDPWAALKNLRKHLKSSGKILISLPNIMHYSVISKLVMGTWGYEEAGILDKTHLRFFTFNEIQKMAITTGFEVKKIGGTTLPATEETKILVEQLALMGQKEIKDQFNIYQYIALFEKESLYDVLENIMDYKDDPRNFYERVKSYTPQKLIEHIQHISDVAHKVDLLNALGVVHFEMGAYDRVLPFFDKAYQLDLENKEVLYNIAYFLEFIGEVEEAATFKNELKKLDPKAYSELQFALDN